MSEDRAEKAAAVGQTDYARIDRLVAESQGGDHGAAGDLLMLFLPMIRQLAAGVESPEDHQDCIQDLSLAFLQQGIARYDAGRGVPFNAFIRSYLILEVLKWESGKYRCYNGGRPKDDQMRLNEPIHEDTLDTWSDRIVDETVDVEAAALTNSLTARLKEVVFGPASPLNPTEKALLRAHYYHRQSIRHLAKGAQSGKRSVETRLRRALAKLREVMQVR